MSGDALGQYAGIIIPQLGVMAPLLLAWAGVGVAALITWGRHPKVSVLALAGCLVLFLNSLASAVTSVLPVMLHQEGWTTAKVGALLSIIGLGRSVLSAAAVAALGVAVFIDRRPAQTPHA